MTCADVMYHQSYPSYFPYQRPCPGVAGAIDHFKKYGVQKTVGGSVSHQGYGGGGGGGGYMLTAPSSLFTTKKETDEDRDSSPPPIDMKYLSTNCALLTYFVGDTSSAVDEHFTRALSHQQQTTGSHFSDRHHKTDTVSSDKETSPMSHRNFPASFWNSNYRPPPLPTRLPAAAHDLSSVFPSSSSVDHYSHMPPPPPAALHHTPDPWRYGFTPQYHHPGISPPDLSYSSFAAHHHYTPLLPSARLGSLPKPYGADGMGKPPGAPPDTWPPRYHTAPSHHQLQASMQAAARHDTHLHSTALSSGLEASLQDTGKDMYWF